MKAILLTFSCGLAALVDGFAQGSLTYQIGQLNFRPAYVFQPDPLHPTVPKRGGALEDYAGFQKVEGIGYTAELWYAPKADAGESSLRPIAGSQVYFRTGATAGLIVGKSKLDIVGTFGGDRVTLQLRVWNNEGRTISQWDLATERGASLPINHVLAGVDRDGSPQLGDSSLFRQLSHFSLAIVPEPSAILLVGFGIAGMLRLSRRGD
ncbi:MAG: PEP-CTERM sorting domain-containing protein [Verrucomicrobiales bacterium]|nr:PEP-CTERM sorting domain-containing protein [Verrucomicrobiales bacterium]